MYILRYKINNHMKITRLLFILALLIVCSSEDPATCPNNFENQLKNACININKDKPCGYFNLNKKCYPKGCDKAEDEDSCKFYLPDDNYDIHTQKCYWDPDANGGNGACITKSKSCGDYNKFGTYSDNNGNDSCSGLSNSEQNCILTSKTTCSKKPIDCNNINPNNDNCDGSTIVTSNLKVKCETSTVEGSIVCRRKTNDEKTCYDFDNLNIYVGEDKNICKSLYTAPLYSCIYFNGYCKEVFTICQSYGTKSTCNDPYSIPVQNGEYKYTSKCYWDETRTSNNCIEINRKCNQYIPGDEERCGTLEPNDPNKQCVVNDNSDSCIEEYTTCNNYSDYSIEKDRKKCEDSLSYLAPGEKCEYHFGQDKCIPKTKTYSTCSEYNSEPGEKDRIVCESIRLATSPFYCVFDKDNQCVERELNCSETFNEEDCLHIAKASDPNKKCAFNKDSKVCYEEYIRCEDYIGKSESNCTKIRLYNGLQCEYDYNSERCRTRNKFCQEARTKEECKLIAKTGVSDPNRKVCDIIGSSCKEIFKYCSDYRGTTPSDCKNIKPYEFEGEKLDKYSKCELEQETKKCQRVPMDCGYGNDNPMLCNEISPNIKNNLTKYCRYVKDDGSGVEDVKNKCIEDYKTCDDYKGYSNSYDATQPHDSEEYMEYERNKEVCEKIIPKGYETGHCKYTLDNNIYKCTANDKCINLLETPNKYRELCYQGNSTCTYDSNGCYEKEMPCKEIRFYDESENNEKICQIAETSKPYKICVLKEDKSGCEEVYRELSFSTAYSSYSEPPGTKSEESSNLIKGINMITILLFLLF